MVCRSLRCASSLIDSNVGYYAFSRSSINKGDSTHNDGTNGCREGSGQNNDALIRSTFDERDKVRHDDR